MAAAIFSSRNGTVAKISKLQKVAMEHQLTTCKLLEELIKRIATNADNIIADARSKTQDLVLKLGQNKQVGQQLSASQLKNKT